MHTIFKFPALRQPVLQGDDICPCLKIQTTYDGTPRNEGKTRLPKQFSRRWSPRCSRGFSSGL
jgi:hypothetical protein